MAILKIARMGHPVLLQKCEPVPDPGAPEIRRLVADMLETMEDAYGAGLAAPQVHVPLRLFVFRVSEARGKAGTRSVLHGLEHIRDQPADRRRAWVRHRVTLLQQDRVSHARYLQDGHALLRGRAGEMSSRHDIGRAPVSSGTDTTEKEKAAKCKYWYVTTTSIRR